MNAQSVQVRLEALTPEWLDAVCEIERKVYTHPWSRANFADSVRANYHCRVLLAGDVLLGYFVAMKGVGEVHLLDIAVAPAYQRQGWALLMLEAIGVWARAQGAARLWLEVRASNVRAQAVYARHGFEHVSIRKNYYPAPDDRRENAVIMSLRLDGPGSHAGAGP